MRPVFPALIALLLAGATEGGWLSFATAADGDHAPIPLPRRSSERNSKRTDADRSGLPSRTSGGWGTTAGALAIVVLLILAGAKVLRPRGAAGPAVLPRDAVEVLGRQPVDDRHSIQLVRCGSRLLLLGVSPAGLTTLTEITDPGEVDSMTELCRTSEPGRMGESFSRWLGHGRDEPDAETSSDGPERDPAVLRLRERLTPAVPSFELSDHSSGSEEAVG